MRRLSTVTSSVAILILCSCRQDAGNLNTSTDVDHSDDQVVSRDATITPASAPQAIAVTNAPEGSIVIYVATAGNAETVLTPANISKIDRLEAVGHPWARLQMPKSLGTFDLASPNSAVRLTMEYITPHPITGVFTSIIWDFPAGTAGLNGYIRASVEDTGAMTAGFQLKFAGFYTSFQDLGKAWLELTISQDIITVNASERQ